LPAPKLHATEIDLRKSPIGTVFRNIEITFRSVQYTVLDFSTVNA